MGKDHKQAARRNLLRKGLGLAMAGAVIPIVVWSKAANAAKADGKLLAYQDHPKNGKRCVDCWAYVDVPNTAEDLCKAIEGPISADGWCKAYSPK